MFFKMLKSTLFISFVILLVQGDRSVYEESDFEDTVLDIRSSTRDVAYRLPNNTKPIEYDIEIELFFEEVFGRQPFTYEGKVTVTFEVVEDNTKEIVLHSNVDQIRSISLFTNDGDVVKLNIQNPFVLEPQYHFLKVNVDENLELGSIYILVIEYSSTMNETPLTRGIWRGRYVDDLGTERIYATTHFQPYNARQAFPCWDEPSFKAVFTLHITRPTKYSAVFANTGQMTFRISNDGRVTDDFYPTPRMSTYLVTFLVSENFEILAEDTEHEPPIRIIGRSNAKGQADRVLELTVGMTDHLSEYFDIPYSSLDANLMNDHIASPDWASAATENWGMVSYRELHILMDPRETIMSVEHYSATLVTHELTHKWFGNLITCDWWSNTWINEGFASYFGYLATHKVFPEYDMHEHFNSRYLQTSLSTDSAAGSVALNHEVNTPPQVTGHFGTISYSKGAAFIRMTVDLISEATFRKACINFLKEHEYQPTDRNDLYNAINGAVIEDGTLTEYTNFDFRNYYYTWVDEPGYPLLTVDINHEVGEMRISQERFFLNPNVNPTEQIYPVPITYTVQSNTDFNRLKPTHILTTESLTITKVANREWVIFNNLQHGHYRVTYDTDSWNLISTALAQNPNTIHYLNRAQIVDDVFALMRAEKMSYVFGFNILKFLENETNYHVWNPAISGYTWLRNRLRHLPENQAEFDAMVLRYLEHVINEVGFGDEETDESITVSLTRQEVLQFSCNIGHETCIRESKERFVNFTLTDAWISPKIRRNVYIVGIREGDSEDYRFLYERFINSNLANDKLEMLRGLGATKILNNLNEYLMLTLTNAIRPQDKVSAFNYALQGNPESANVALQFVKDNYDLIRTTYIGEAPNNPVHTALSNLASYLDESGLVEMEKWLEETRPIEYISAMNAISTARSNIEWGSRKANEIMSAVRGGAPRLVVSLMLVKMLYIVIFCV